jgi:hypothetical protein
MYELSQKSAVSRAPRDAAILVVSPINIDMPISNSPVMTNEAVQVALPIAVNIEWNIPPTPLARLTAGVHTTECSLSPEAVYPVPQVVQKSFAIAATKKEKPTTILIRSNEIAFLSKFFKLVAFFIPHCPIFIFFIFIEKIRCKCLSIKKTLPSHTPHATAQSVKHCLPKIHLAKKK